MVSHTTNEKIELEGAAKIIKSELVRAVESWWVGVADAVRVRGISDFVPSFLPPFIAPFPIRVLNALSSLPEFMLAGFTTAAARVVLPVINRRRDLGSKVVPLKSITTAIGPPFLRSLVTVDQAPTQIPRLPGQTLVEFFGAKSLTSFLKPKLEAIAINWIARFLNLTVRIGAIAAGVVILLKLEAALLKIEDGVLRQDKKRKWKCDRYVRVPFRYKISRRNRAPKSAGV